jgi:hypothetical protein
VPVESRRHASAPASILQGWNLQAQRDEAYDGCDPAAPLKLLCSVRSVA